MFVTIVDVVFTPFEISFFQFDRQNSLINEITLTLEILFIFDIIINYRTAFYERGVITTNAKAVIVHYLKGEFILDAIPLLFNIIGVALWNTWAWFFKGIKFLRQRKLQLLFTRVEEYFNLEKSSSAVIKLGRLILTLIVAAHWLACMFHLVANNEPQEETTWLLQQGLNDLPIGERYAASLYWSVMTMMTVGYGDIHPVNSVERMVVIGAMVLACALFGYSLNTLGTAITQMNEEKAVAREKIRNLRNYMNQKKLGRNIQVRVKNYIEYMIESKRIHKHDEDQFMHLLSQNLKDEITSEVNGKILVECQLFASNFSYKSTMSLSKYMYEKFLSPEELVFEEGDEEDKSIYFISYGKIQIYNKSKVIKELTTSESFGELAFFSGQPRQASAKSLLFSSLFYLSSETAQEYLRKHPQDFENFHMIRGDINLYNKYDLVETRCYSCNELGHIARNCPKLHLVLNKQEIIQKHLEEEKTLRQSFLRPNRRRFHVLLNLFELQKCALEVMEDFFDEEPSDDDLSQDSVDLILERNLYLIPAAEQQDMILRRAERRTKTIHYTQMGLFEDFQKVNKELDHDLSDAETVSDAPEKINDLIFFSIDKVENFETFYPHNNIMKQMGDFEKRRLQKIQQSEGGVMKALFLKTLMGGRKNLLIQVQRGRRNTKNFNQIPSVSGRLKKSMRHALSNKGSDITPRAGGSLTEAQDKKPSGYNLNVMAPETPTQLIESSSEEDIATLSKTEARIGDRKNFNIKQYMNQINSGFNIRMPSSRPSYTIDPNASPNHANEFSPGGRGSFSEFSPVKDAVPSNKADIQEIKTFANNLNKFTNINYSNPTNSNKIDSNSSAIAQHNNRVAQERKAESRAYLEELILKNIVEEETKQEVYHNGKTKVLRSLSFDKMENLKKNIDKYQVVDSIKNIIEKRFPRQYSELFGRNM